MCVMSITFFPKLEGGPLNAHPHSFGARIFLEAKNIPGSGAEPRNL